MPDRPDLIIEYPSAGATYSHDTYGVYGYSTYPDHSVLAGQQRRSFLRDFPTLEAAKAAYPDASWDGAGSSGYVEPHIPVSPPEWFDPANAGEAWGEDDY
jgi:hypothetical protein